MFDFVQSVLALFAALAFCLTSLLLLFILLDSFTPSFFRSTMYAELIDLVDRYTVLDTWSQSPERRHAKVAALRKTSTFVRENSDMSDDGFDRHDQFSTALIWGASKKSLARTFRKRRRSAFKKAMADTRRELLELDAAGVQQLLDGGEAAIAKGAWRLRRSALEAFGKPALRTLVLRHGKHAAFAGLAGTALFFFAFAVLKMAGVDVVWSSAWSFFTDFFVLLVLAAVPVLALATTVRAGFKGGRREAAVALVASVLPIGLIGLVAVNASSAHGPITRWYEFSSEWSQQIVDGLPPFVVGLIIGSGIVARGVFMIVRVPRHRRAFPHQVSERLDTMAEASVVIGCGAAFGLIGVLMAGRFDISTIWYAVIPAFALAAAFRVLSIGLALANRFSSWTRDSGRRRGFWIPHPLLILTGSILGNLGAAAAFPSAFSSRPFLGVLEGLMAVCMCLHLIVGTPVAMVCAWRLRVGRAREDLRMLDTETRRLHRQLAIQAVPSEHS